MGNLILKLTYNTRIMATIANISKDERDELVCTYAALLLHDSNLGINGDKLNQVIKASGNEVEPYWPGLFAKALEGADIDALLTNVGAPAAAPATAPAAEVEVAPVVEDKVEKEPEDDVYIDNLFPEDDY